MAALRAPGGCPWDREQTIDTLKKYVLEETYELLEAIDRHDHEALREELGDFLFEAVFVAQLEHESGYFSIADSVTRELAYQPALDAAWVAGGMNIPAGKEATFTWADDPRAFFSLLGSPLDTTNGFNIEAVMFHMHSLGRVGEVWLVKPNGRVQVLNIPDWDFHWQNEYQLAEPVRFEPGDQLRVKCTFDNTAGTNDVNWGEGSADEMCVANILSSK